MLKPEAITNELVGRPTRAKLVLSWVRCESLAMAYAQLPGSTLLKKILDVSWGTARGSIAYGIAIDALPCSTTFVPFGLAPANVSHPRLS